MDPVTVLSLYDTLCAKNHTKGIILCKCFKNALYFVNSKLLGSFTAEAGEYLISVVMVMTVIVASALTVLVVVVMMMMLVVVTSALALLVVVVMMMLVVVTSALTVLVVVVMVMMLVVVTSALAVLVMIVMVMMLVVVASALTMLIVVVMVVMLVVVTSTLTVLVVVVMVMMLVVVASALTMLVVVVVMVMLVIVTSALTVLVVVVVVMLVVMLMLLLKLVKSVLEGILLLHSGKNILAVKLVPRSCYDSSGSVVLSDKLNGSLDLLCLGKVGMRKNDRGSVGNLVIVELAKVLHIHLALIHVCNGSEAIELGILSLYRLDSLDNVGELTNSAGLDDNAVGVELVKHLNKRLGKITNEGAADAAGVHLCNFDAGILKKASVNTDLTELVFYKHKLF